MAVKQAARISEALIAQGAPKDMEIDVAADVTRKTETVFQCTVGTMAEALAGSGIQGGAILLLTWPQSGFAQSTRQVIGKFARQVS